MWHRLLTSTLGIAAATVLAFAAGLAISIAPHRWPLEPMRIGLIALGALLIALGLAMAQARRLARPLQKLARAADRIGSGDTRPVGRRYGIAELDRIADGLDFTV